MNKKAILGLVAAAIVLVHVAIVGWYWYEGDHFVATEDARVAANLVAISPEIPGKILEWNVKEGDLVRAGDVLGRQDLGNILSTGAINTMAMILGLTSFFIGSVPRARMASICSLTIIEPSSAAIPEPTRPASIRQESTGPSSLMRLVATSWPVWFANPNF